MEGADDPVAYHDPADAIPDSGNFAGAIAQRHDSEPCRAAAATLQHHQVTVVERGRAHPKENLPSAGPRIVAQPRHHPVNAAEMIDAVGSHLSILDRPGHAPDALAVTVSSISGLLSYSCRLDAMSDAA